MARKTPSRLELRRQAEAVEAIEADGATEAPKKKKAAKKATRARKTKEKPEARRQLLWVIYNGSMKEEGRFNFDQKAAAEERLEVLRGKSKKLYFMQPLKEPIGEAVEVTPVIPDPDEAVPAAAPYEIENESIDEDAEIEEADVEVDDDTDDVDGDIVADDSDDDDDDDDDDSDD